LLHKIAELEIKSVCVVLSIEPGTLEQTEVRSYR